MIPDTQTKEADNNALSVEKKQNIKPTPRFLTASTTSKEQGSCVRLVGIGWRRVDPQPRLPL